MPVRLLEKMSPDLAADFVVNRYVEEGGLHLDDWAARYRDEVRDYLGNPNSQAVAKAALANWYRLLIGRRADISRLYADIRGAHKSSKPAVIARVAPAPR